jgi:hypothetical protein
MLLSLHTGPISNYQEETHNTNENEIDNDQIEYSGEVDLIQN